MSRAYPRSQLLHTRYAQSFASKHATLAQAWRAFVDGPGEVRFDELQQLVHRLAGSAPTYGYERLGALALAVDSLLADWQKSPPPTRGTFADLALGLAMPMRALIDGLAGHAAHAAAAARGDQGQN